MSKGKIFIVEDEVIVALGIKKTLMSLEYQIAGIADTGEKALASIEANRPDLILMDIQLKGRMDGIQTAAKVKELYGLPVIFLTAFSDSVTLGRAKITEPYGYLVKPFQKRELSIAVDMALYKYRIERKLRESETRFRHLAESIPDGITIIENGKITFINDQACHLFNRSRENLMNMDISRNTGIGLEDDALDLEETGDLVITPMGVGVWMKDRDGNQRCIQKRNAYCRKGGQIISRYVITTDITDCINMKTEISLPDTLIEDSFSGPVLKKEVKAESLEELMDFLDGFDEYNGIIRQRDHAALKNRMNLSKQAIFVPFLISGESPLSKWMIGQAKQYKQVVPEEFLNSFSGETSPLFLPLSDDLAPPVYAVLFEVYPEIIDDLALIQDVIPFSVILTPELSESEFAKVKIIAESITHAISSPLFLLIAHHDRFARIPAKDIPTIDKIMGSELKWQPAFLGKQTMEFFSIAIPNLES